MADIAHPEEAQGLVLFAHGSGSSRLSPRNRAVAAELQRAGLATVLVDLPRRKSGSTPVAAGCVST
jgi:predicted alpha/beta-hydrolase family hydrolase